ncbi:sensor histidine kinase [Dinghuibacter silviterrae]|uniref:sensor histidine kinase n=1 Tax=Dinghuibacter silviterrae TaxID=1539049 RepID=UPI0010636885|nr:HAMP domain-containing sensor histidine kinase [Dinghuibacter silviterrae]
MNLTIAAYRAIAIAGFLVLSGVQFFLLYNTYELKNEQFFQSKKEPIGGDYLTMIRNDKVIPGGQRILDGFINKDMMEMERLYKDDRMTFDHYRQRVCDSAFAALARANNLDSALRVVRERRHLSSPLSYAIFVRSLDVSFRRDQYVSCYNNKVWDTGLTHVIQTDYGVRIGGNLFHIHPRSLVTSLTVSASRDYSYRITADLYVDTADRQWTIFRRMLPAFLLSLFSIGSVVLLFYLTFQNWRRQKQLSEMKSDFINGITHEFHTPLAAIMVANRAIQSEKQPLLPLTEVIERQAERLKTLIGNVLNIATLHRIDLHKRAQSVHALLDKLVSDYRLQRPDIVLFLDKNATRDTAALDPFWFGTIFLNIFDNAVKYNNKDEKQVHLLTSSDRKNLYVEIRDNGIGIPSSVREHIFDKFYRDTRSVQGSVKGLGLGLYYVRTAVDAHEWTITVDSTEGEGSAFLITIPL